MVTQAHYRYQIIVTTRATDGRELQAVERDVRSFDRALKAAFAERAGCMLFPDSFIRVEIFDTMARRGRPNQWVLDQYGNPQITSRREVVAEL